MPGHNRNIAAEQRNHPRYQIKLPVNLHGERWSRALLVDLSRGGMWLRANASEPVGQRLAITMRRYGADEDAVCTAHGRVVRVSSTPRASGYAVEFDRNDPNLDALLDAAEALPPRDRSVYLSTELRPTLEIERR